MCFKGQVPRFLCASVLLVAASLKGYALATDPAHGVLYGSRWLQYVLVEYEVLLAAWLLSGFAQAACRKVALATFAGFGCYALYLAVTGAVSCGCFGAAEMNPWWTFALDCVVFLLVWRWMPTTSVSRVTRLAGVVALPIAVGIALAIIVAAQPRAAIADGITTSGSTVLLEPEKWVGKPFPLFAYIDIGERLRHGSWELLIYRHDCAKCQEAIASLATDTASQSSLVLVEIPPFSAKPRSLDNLAFLEGQLENGRRWLVSAPVYVSIDNGRVVSVSSDGQRTPVSFSDWLIRQ